MKRVVEEVVFTTQRPKLIRGAAYARVSSGNVAMLHSLAAQVDYYSRKIRHHQGWEYVGVYADKAKTGTKDNRKEFQRLLKDCRAGKIDRVLTKSVSRFARNTVTLLETVRELKSLGIAVYFEEQNIDTSSAEGEVMLTILAGFAEEESLSASENQKWRVKRNFEAGKPWNTSMLGYRNDNGTLVIVPEEAEIIKSIYHYYLSGDGIEAIMKRLNADGALTRTGGVFHKSSVERVLRNYAYTGNLILQTKYRENHLTKRTLVNQGELPKYHVENSHEAIIPFFTFEAVHEEIKRRKEIFAPKKKPGTYPLSSMVTCALCGKNYRRKTTRTGIIWICPTYNTYGKSACPAKAVPEETLLQEAKAAGGLSRIKGITAAPDNTLIFHLKNGRKVTRCWQDRSRRESWTKEMRKAAARKTKERSVRHGKESHRDSCDKTSPQ